VKLSGARAEQRAAWLAYIEQRWGQLSKLQLDFGVEAVKYLFATNAGAAAGVLAYLGAVKPSPIPAAFLWMLVSFLLGVVLVGLTHAARYHGASRLLRAWRTDVLDFYSDRVAWDELLKRDAERALSFAWDEALAWAAFACVVAGAAIGGIAIFRV
jgi:hypothetical protein